MNEEETEEKSKIKCEEGAATQISDKMSKSTSDPDSERKRLAAERRKKIMEQMAMAQKITILLWCQTVHKILIDKMIVVVISDPNRCCKISFHTSSTVQKEN